MISKLFRQLKEKGLFSTIVFCFSFLWWKIYGMRASEIERRHPQPVQSNKIVFESFDSHPDNVIALYEYLVKRDLQKKYEIVWLADHPRQCRELLGENVQVVKKSLACGKISTKAFREIYSAKYVFFTVAMNWAKVVQKDQLYVNLWHGCSFKSTGHVLGRWIFFDYLLVPSPFFVALKAPYFSCPPEKILPIGYPRYDIMKSGKPEIASMVKKILAERNAKKLILWLPTYRKSKSIRLNENTLDNSEFNLPIIYDRKMLDQLNDICKAQNVLIVIKRHQFSDTENVDTRKYSNIDYIDDEWLMARKVNLYVLLHEADALITDYSSVGVDFLLLDKPIAYTLDDFEQYKASRGFTVDQPLDYMPGHYIYQYNDFVGFIQDMAEGKDPYREKRRKVTSELHVPCDCYCQKLTEKLGLVF